MSCQLSSNSRRALERVLRLVFTSVLVIAATRVPARAGGDLSVATGKIAPAIAAAIRSGGTRRLLLRMTQQADLSGAALLTNKIDKGRYVYAALRAVADHTQPAVCTKLAQMGMSCRPFYVANIVLADAAPGRTIESGVLGELGGRPDIAEILTDDQFTLDDSAQPVSAAAAPAGVAWNIAWIHAPDVWNTGARGQGIVYANIDSGVEWRHEALIGNYRGWNGSSADNNYNWWDATRENRSDPVDTDGHGTHAMGTAVGTHGIGVAPDAKWMACRAFDGANTTFSSVLDCLEFMLAPWDLNHENPNPDKAPDVVGHSYGGLPPSSELTAMRIALENLEAAGIVNAGAAGNSGSCKTAIGFPQGFSSVISVGALKFESTEIAAFSSKGPGPVTVIGGAAIRPSITAPGKDVLSATLDGGYGPMTGTSMSTPMVAGAVVVTLSKRPELIGQPGAIRKLLAVTAIPHTSAECGGGSSPNDVYGYGELDLPSLALSSAKWPLASLLH